MQSFVIKKTIKAPIEKVWASWDDFANIDIFNPNIIDSYLLPGYEGRTKVGTKRHCTMPGGKKFVNENITVYEPMKRIELEVYKTNLPIKKMVIDTVFISQPGDITEIIQTTNFELKMGVVGKLLGPVMKKQFEPMMGKLLNGNKDYLEKGTIANKAS